MVVSCPVNNLAFVIPREAKESRFEIATPACHNKALRCAGMSLTLLAMTVYRRVGDGTPLTFSTDTGKYPFFDERHKDPVLS